MPPSSDLNAAQRKAVQTLRGPLLVLAGAGSGKTRVITYRIHRLIRSGTPASRVLAVTFTNKAAREMRERVSALLDKRRDERPEISTFHSLCVRILRRHIGSLGYPTKFAIYDAADQESVARRALRQIRVDESKLRPGDLLGLISGWKSRAIWPDAAAEEAESDREQLAAAAYARYQEALRASGVLDFDDLLLLTERLFDTFPEVKRLERDRFDHVLVDEYQDTSSPQYRIVRALAEGHRNLCVVGDDDQSIYGWRGAEVAHILSFPRDWPDAKVISLEQNYRSVGRILQLANVLIGHNSNRHEKKLLPVRDGGEPPRFVKFEDETSEASSIAREVGRLIDPAQPERVNPRDIAILFRTNEQPRAFEVELRRAKIPYRLVGSHSFYDRKEIRDLLAYFKILVNPQDEVSLLRVVNTPPRGIGATTLQTALKAAVKAGCPLWNVLSESKIGFDCSPAVLKRIQDFCGQIEGFRQRLGREPLVDLAQTLIEQIDYKAELQRCYKEGGELEARWNSVKELINALADYTAQTSAATLSGFLEETVLNAWEKQRDEDDDAPSRAVNLMTLHSAKGLEFEHVYLVGLEEGLLPHRRSVECDDPARSIAEERRLCYVGVTRAKTKLTLSFCAQRRKWGKLRPSIPSRFLMEMRGETEKAQRAALAAEREYEKTRAS